MDALIQLSEILRNLALPLIGLLAALVAVWQARMSEKRNGIDQLARSVELLSSQNSATRRAAFAMLLDATQNKTIGAMALEALSAYIDEVDDNEELRALSEMVRKKPDRQIVDAIVSALEKPSRRRGTDG